MSILSLIVILPFVSALILAILYLSNPSKERFGLYSLLGLVTPIVVTILAGVLLLEMMDKPTDFVSHATLFEWISLGDFHIDVAFMADRLSVVMVSFVTFIGTLIHIYAVGYMRGDAGFGKFFSYFNLFLGSMLLLVLADNPIMMFVGWELVGLASYLLIGFYHRDSANITAANKAFILNRVGDFGFIMGLALLFVVVGSSGYTFGSIEANVGSISSGLLPVIGLLLFVGAMGKSAQIPLFVWLPDAMAGPTPVSALIHAATMVTAGVYMVARFGFLYNQIPEIGLFIATIGIASALFAAIIALYQTDIKKILAYSTMSQLGYMFVAVGLGAYSSGIFHVFTHAFFKALLFMGAGAVIIALHHEQSISKMSGVYGAVMRQRLGLVYITMLVATLAISGIPPFAGFFSKDAILMTAFASGNYTIWAIGTLTALLTALYMFRLFFIVFHAKQSPKAKKEQSKSLTTLDKTMTIPLVILAVGAGTAGLLGVNEAFGGSNLFGAWIALPDVTHHVTHSTEYLLTALNVAMGLIGIALAYRWYYDREVTEVSAPRSFWANLAWHKFYVDELYEQIIVKPILWKSHFLDRVMDIKVFDGVLAFVVWGYRHLGHRFARLQNAKVRYYALYILIGVSIMSLFLLITLKGL